MHKVVIIEDNEVIRNGLKLLINGTAKYSCSAAFLNCEEAFDYISSEKPEFLLIDLELPGMSGIEGIKKIRKISEKTITIVLTVYGENELLFEAIKVGAFGYILKNTPSNKILSLLDDLCKGESTMSAQIARQVLDLFYKNGKKVNGKLEISLTKLEKQILKGLVEGNSPKAVADEITLDIGSIRENFFNIYTKMHQYTKY